DHGKTTLLDALRQTNVAQKEAGGITQHVAAYQIETKSNKTITFIDTPGHAAFSSIRTRGTVITDIIILVVAADDGIKEQTIEIIQQAKGKNVPIIVAINKIDKPNANVDRVKTELMNYEVILEDFGGDVLSVEISALNRINLDGLVDAILLQAEMLELNAGIEGNSRGTILESRVDRGKGIISSVIIQHGILKEGDIFVAGASYGKVRIIFDDNGKRIYQALPSAPVEIVGFDTAPEPGDLFVAIESEQKAREIAEYRKRTKSLTLKTKTSKTLEQVIEGSRSSVQTLNIIIKADVYGSLEAIIASIDLIKHPEIKINIVSTGVGIISENDIDFAQSINAITIGFNVSIIATAKELSKLYEVKILNHSVIYHMIEEIKKIMSKMLAPTVEEHYIGVADVRKLFTISRFGTIAGCYVLDGVIKKHDSKIKVKRGEDCIFEGKIKSMKHEKDEIKEAKYQHECGILTDGFNDFREGDKIECYEIVLKFRSLD
ncbi:MAG: translation initiation factor IF-2, partial [Holosporales bacterium]|nr:translation initiation factor IF-2 [Holosporales bacterium]